MMHPSLCSPGQRDLILILVLGRTIRMQSEQHSQRHIHRGEPLARHPSGAGGRVGAFACNQRLLSSGCGGAKRGSQTKNYALLNIYFFVSYFTYNFVWFWFCTIYTMRGPRAPTVDQMLHCRWLCLAAARFDLSYTQQTRPKDVENQIITE